MRLWPLAFACAFLSGCSTPPPGRALFWWKTAFDPDSSELAALRTLGIARMHVRLFDVDAENGSAHPVAALEWKAPLPRGIEPVPTVFVRERALRGLDRGAARELAALIWSETRFRMAGSARPWRELLVDCDWTESTKEPYFALLSALGDSCHASGRILSSTIRLHQLRDRSRTGVPPVDRGLLMFYNMGRISASPTDTSLLDLEAGRSWLAGSKPYPLPLDPALPLWEWTIQLRDGAVVDLLQRTGSEEIDRAGWIARDSAGTRRAKREGFLDGHFLREGDLLKVEAVRMPALREAAGMLVDFLPRDRGRTVVLFDLDRRNLVRLPPDSLETIYVRFGAARQRSP